MSKSVVIGRFEVRKTNDGNFDVRVFSITNGELVDAISPSELSPAAAMVYVNGLMVDSGGFKFEPAETALSGIMELIGTVGLEFAEMLRAL